jgi:ABC-type cobalamin/Fe3+-siderophores transport system ATPase subunit
MNNGTVAASGKIDKVLSSDTLNTVFGIDIRKYMKESLELWH